MNPGPNHLFPKHPMNQSALYQRGMRNSIPYILTFSPTYLYRLTLPPPRPPPLSSLNSADMDRSVSTTKPYRPKDQPIHPTLISHPIPSTKFQKRKRTKRSQKHTSAPNQIPSPRRTAINPTRIELALGEKPPRGAGIHEREVRVQDPFPAALDCGGGAGMGGGGGGGG